MSVIIIVCLWSNLCVCDLICVSVMLFLCLWSYLCVCDLISVSVILLMCLVVQNSDTPACSRGGFMYGCWQRRGGQQRWTNCSSGHSLKLMWSQFLRLCTVRCYRFSQIFDHSYFFEEFIGCPNTAGVLSLSFKLHVLPIRTLHERTSAGGKRPTAQSEGWYY
jgi:hypothetical protein